MKNIRYLNNYVVVYDPSNHCSMKSKNWNGYVYEHRKVYEDHYGVKLTKDDIIHHKDGNKQNNTIDNLELSNKEEHGKIHYIKKQYFCKCGCKITRRATICNKCRLIRPDKQVLLELLKTKSYSEIAKELSVSWNSVKNWCVKYNLMDL